jgi:hypothetical protein
VERGAVAAAPEYTVSGRVLDQSGEPVPGMGVFVGAEDNPFEREHTQRVGHLYGILFPTDEHGYFVVDLPGPGEVKVAASTREMWVRSIGESAMWVDPPESGVDLTVKAIPFGTLIVRAVDLTTQKELKDFRISVYGIDPEGHTEGSYRHGFATMQTTDGRIIRKWPVEYGEGIDVEVQLAKPAVYSDTFSRALGIVGLDEPEKISKQIRLHAGETREVTLEIRFDQNAAGLVVDELGLPIEDAIVYFGTGTDARGDEPFKRFDERRISGARTDTTGWYELAGSGPFVTAWHPDYSPTTVQVDESVRIVLPARGGIRGRVPAPLPRTGTVEVLLDFRDAQEATANGSFEFENVEAGSHAIVLPGKRIVVAHVEPGAITDVTLDDTLDHVRMRLHRDGARLDTPFQGALIGLAPVSSLLEVLADAGECEWGDVVPGDYVLLSSSGHASIVTIDGPDVRVGLGESDLLVRGRPGHVPLVLPAGHEHNPILRLMAPRISRRIPTAGELHFAPRPGTYVVVDSTTGSEQRVDVRGTETVVTLP